MKRKVTYAAVFVLASQVSAIAYGGSGDDPSTASWLKEWQDKGLVVRQTFDGTKNELNAARVGYLQPSYVVDLGVKLVDWQPFSARAKHSLIVSPLLEWHHTNTP